MANLVAMTIYSTKIVVSKNHLALKGIEAYCKSDYCQVRGGKWKLQEHIRVYQGPAEQVEELVPATAREVYKLC
jgi:hypothetical protein